MASTPRARRRITAAIGGAAVFAMIGFTAACSSDSGEPEESPTTTTTTSEVTLTPTEKNIEPGVTINTAPPTPSQFRTD